MLVEVLDFGFGEFDHSIGRYYWCLRECCEHLMVINGNGCGLFKRIGRVLIVALVNFHLESGFLIKHGLVDL